METKATENTASGLDEKRLPLWRKIGYGIGDFGSNYCWTFVATFFMIYITNTVGISSAVVGTLLLVSKVLDGITDVVMGRIIDMTKSKMGKARFWYLVSSLPTAISVFLLFNIPAVFTENTKYIYTFIIYTLMGAVFYTMNNIAYSSLTALVTKNPRDRVSLGSIRSIFSMLAAIVIASTTPSIVNAFGGGQQGWFYTSILYSIICFVLLLIPFFSVKELPAEDLYSAKEMSRKEKGGNKGFFRDFKLLVKNQYFILILLIYLVNALITGGVIQSMGIYFATYVLGDASYLGLMNIAGTVYSCSSIGLKIGTGLGTALCGIMLEIGGFNGLAEVQTASAISTIQNLYIYAGLIGAIVLLVLIYFLKVETSNKKLRTQGGIET